jgi:MFS family permease
MSDASSDPVVGLPLSPRARSIRAYIDETPVWFDGTPVSGAPMTWMQWRIWTLAAAGKFFEGLVVFMTGVAMPLISEEFGLTRAQHGVVGAASLFGILIGAIGLGGLSDYFGRKSMFIVEMIIFTIFLVLLVASPSACLTATFGLWSFYSVLGSHSGATIRPRISSFLKVFLRARAGD